MRRLDGKHSLVTGGGTGIGLGCARALLRAGATVTIAARRADVLEKAAAGLAEERRGDAEVRWTTCDVTREEDVARAVAHATDESGHLDVVVANAGTGFGSYFLLTDAAALRQALDLNVVGTFNTIQAGALAMKDGGGGSIICMSSVAAVLTHTSLPAYCAAKAGMEMLMRCAADDLGRFGIRVNAVRPGIVASEIMEQFVIPNREVIDDYLENMPIRRVGTVEDVAAVVRFLAGSESSWITGQALGVDGGHALRRGPNYDLLMRPLLGEEAWARIRGESGK